MECISEYLKDLLAAENLDMERAENLLDLIFAGQVNEPQIAAFLTALEAKGPSSAEIAGFARSLRKHAVKVTVDFDRLVDTCGTGGSGSVKSLNVSTAAGIVAAGAGVRVAKHGNRGITSGCGSADVLEALGVNIAAGPDVVARCIDQAGIGFMFAPSFHPAMKYVQPIRKSLGFRTVFNILGPLANPARANAQVLGVANEALMELVVNSLKLMGSQFAMVVYSRQGVDEISTAGLTRVACLKDGQISYYELNPDEYGFGGGDTQAEAALNASTSAERIREVLAGSKGPASDMVVINAAAAIVAGGKADDIAVGIEMAREAIENGKAQQAMDTFIRISNS